MVDNRRKQMTTRVELQKWLDQFPEDTDIQVLTSEDNTCGYESYTSVYQTELQELGPVDTSICTYEKTFEVVRDYKTGHITIVLGVKN
jgi:hypothetical protein